MDRRQQKTRTAIFQAFIKLLESKSYSNITVQEIIDIANIGRSTFYSHFETKDELLKTMCTEIFEHVFSEELTKEKTHDFSSEEGGFDKKITHILYHLQDKGRQINRILSCESGEIFMMYLKQYLRDIFVLHLEQTKDNVPEEYILNHMVCSFAETIRWWLRENQEYKPEEIAAFYLAVVPAS